MWVWGRRIHGMQILASMTLRGRHWREGDGSPALRSICSHLPLFKKEKKYLRDQMNMTFWEVEAQAFSSILLYLVSSNVSPNNGLNGFPVRSHWDATAETAKAATTCCWGEGDWLSFLLPTPFQAKLTFVTNLLFWFLLKDYTECVAFAITGNKKIKAKWYGKEN